ncbi:mandelate racemase [bacterium]|nr:mandelate racemase [bacterium]
MNCTRRAFLKKTGAGTAALMVGGGTVLGRRTAATIERIQVFPVVYPMKGRFKFFEDIRGTMRGRAAAIVKITASDGVVGWGESVPIPRWSYETLESVTSTIRNYFAPLLTGLPVPDPAELHRLMSTAIAPSFNTGQPIAKAGIDIALHDLIGRMADISLPGVWGLTPAKSITLSWTLNPKTPDLLDGLIDQGRSLGYRHFNVKVSPDPDTDLALCRRARKAAPDGFLWADANGGYDPDTALRTAPMLADAGVDVLEQPLRPNCISGYRALKKQGALPILMDEGLVDPRTLEEFIALDMLDGVAMKPSRCGGLFPARLQIDLLHRHGLMLLGSGLTDPDISLAATLALFGAYGCTGPAALNGPQFIDFSVLKEPLLPRDGTLRVPRGPGLGIAVDEEKIRDIEVSI